MHWYVQVQNHEYGPYTESQMQGFVSEGRIHAGSLISNAPQQGFFAASGYDVFSLWAGTGSAAQVQTNISAAGGGAMQYQRPQVRTEHAGNPSPAHAAAPRYTRPAPAQYNTADRHPGGQAKPDHHAVYVIMAEIRSSGAMVFLKAMETHGPVQRIGDTVWLLRCGLSPEQLRNQLSQVLDRQDRLFIADANAGQPAWFNIGADLDHRIRDFWSSENGEN